MIGLGRIWLWIILGVLAISQNARGFATSVGTDLKNLGRIIAAFTWSKIRRTATFTVYLIAGATVVMTLGIFWLATLKFLALAMLIVWFAILLFALYGIAGLLENTITIPSATWGNITTPEIDLSRIGKPLAKVFRIGIKPILMIIFILISLGIQIIAFPGIGSTLGMFILLALIGNAVINAYEGKPPSLALGRLYITLGAISVVASLAVPNANAWLDEKGKAMKVKVSASILQQNVENESWAVFSAGNYTEFWEVDLKDLPIFYADGKPAGVNSVLSSIDEKKVLVLKWRVKVSGGTNGIDFSLIQTHPGATSEVYLVPRRCLDIRPRKDPGHRPLGVAGGAGYYIGKDDEGWETVPAGTGGRFSESVYAGEFITILTPLTHLKWHIEDSVGEKLEGPYPVNAKYKIRHSGWCRIKGNISRETKTKLVKG